MIIDIVIASKTFEFFIFIFPCSIIIFPIFYILDDILSEIYGYKKTRRVIFLGFFMNLIAIVCFTITINMPSPQFFEHHKAYAIVLGSSTRIIAANFISYLVGSLVNAKVMVFLKDKYDGKKLFFRCIFSTIVGGGLDAIIFIFIAFYGTIPVYALLIMLIGQILFKPIY